MTAQPTTVTSQRPSPDPPAVGPRVQDPAAALRGRAAGSGSPARVRCGEPWPTGRTPSTCRAPTFPMKANLQAAEPAGACALGGRWTSTGRSARRARGRPEVRPARRPAVRQRRHPHRHRAQQDPQGLRRQVADDGRLRRARTCRAGTATACRSSSRSTRELGPKKARDERRPTSGAPAAPTPTASSTSSAPTSSASACFGDWDDPYLTMNYDYEAAIVRALGRFVEQGLVYKGKKPVHWCIARPHGAGRGRGRVRGPHLAVDLRRVPADAVDAGELAARVPALAGRDVSVLIWTTTPWTIPSNLAIAFHPGLRLRRRTTSTGGVVIVARDAGRGTVGKATGKPLGDADRRAMKGEAFERHRVPAPALRPRRRSACSPTT